MLALQTPLLALIGCGVNVCALLVRPRKQPVCLENASRCSLSMSQAVNFGMQVQEIGTELLEPLVIQRVI